MGLAAGKLRDQVQILQKSDTTDGLGQRVKTWANFGTPIWAWVKFMNGKESIAANQEFANVVASVRIRYRTDITPQMRLIFNGTPYDIKSVLPGETREHVDLVISNIEG